MSCSVAILEEPSFSLNPAMLSAVANSHTCMPPLAVGADDPPEVRNATADAPADTRCLVRAVGTKKKISTMITAKDYRRFAQSYGNILKVSLDSLKKREKKKGSDKKGATKAT